MRPSGSAELRHSASPKTKGRAEKAMATAGRAKRALQERRSAAEARRRIPEATAREEETAGTSLLPPHHVPCSAVALMWHALTAAERGCSAVARLYAGTSLCGPRQLQQFLWVSHVPGAEVSYGVTSTSCPALLSALQVHVFGGGLRGGQRQPLQQRGALTRQQGFNHYDNGRGLWVRPKSSHLL